MAKNKRKPRASSRRSPSATPSTATGTFRVSKAVAPDPRLRTRHSTRSSTHVDAAEQDSPVNDGVTQTGRRRLPDTLFPNGDTVPHQPQPSPPPSHQLANEDEDSTLQTSGLYAHEHDHQLDGTDQVRLVNGVLVRYINGAVDLTFNPDLHAQNHDHHPLSAIQSFNSDTSAFTQDEYSTHAYPGAERLDHGSVTRQGSSFPSPPSEEVDGEQDAEADEYVPNGHQHGPREPDKPRRRRRTKIPAGAQQSDAWGTTWVPPMHIPPVPDSSPPLAVHVMLETFRGFHLDLSGSATQKLLHLPMLRELEPRDLTQPGATGRRRSSKPRSVNMSRRCNVDAAVVYIIGVEKRVPCKSCRNGHGPWKRCIVFQGEAKGACANCWFNASGTRCSFKENEAQPLIVTYTNSFAARQFQAEAQAAENNRVAPLPVPPGLRFHSHGHSDANTPRTGPSRAHTEAPDTQDEDQLEALIPRRCEGSHVPDLAAHRRQHPVPTTIGVMNAIRDISPHQRNLLCHTMNNAGQFNAHQRLLARVRAAAEEFSMRQTELHEWETQANNAPPRRDMHQLPDLRPPQPEVAHSSPQTIHSSPQAPPHQPQAHFELGRTLQFEEMQDRQERIAAHAARRIARLEARVASKQASAQVPSTQQVLPQESSLLRYPDILNPYGVDPNASNGVSGNGPPASGGLSHPSGHPPSGAPPQPNNQLPPPSASWFDSPRVFGSSPPPPADECCTEPQKSDAPATTADPLKDHTMAPTGSVAMEADMTP